MAKKKLILREKPKKRLVLKKKPTPPRRRVNKRNVA